MHQDWYYTGSESAKVVWMPREQGQEWHMEYTECRRQENGTYHTGSHNKGKDSDLRICWLQQYVFVNAFLAIHFHLVKAISYKCWTLPTPEEKSKYIQN